MVASIRVQAAVFFVALRKGNARFPIMFRPAPTAIAIRKLDDCCAAASL